LAARSLLVRVVLLGCISIALLWPAIWNCGAFYTPDTRTYIRTADAAVNKVTHRATAWTATDDHAAPGATAPNADLALHNIGEARTRSLADIGKKGILLGRSPFYGLLLYTGTLAAGFWLPMLLQAAILLLAVCLALRALKCPVWPNLAYASLGLCAVSTVPFFLSFLMPDLYAGIAILCCAVLLSTSDRLPWTDLLLWYALLSACLLFHDTCVLITVSLFGVGLVAKFIGRFAHRRGSWLAWRGLAVLLLAILTASAGQAVVAYGAKKVTGRPALHLPYVSARLVADGPGSNYLHATCPQSNFALCEYVAEFPLTTGEFLFGAEPGHTVFELAPYDKRRALSEEQFRFLFAVLRYDPMGVLKVSTINAIEQLADFRLDEFQYDPGTKDVFDRTFPLPIVAQIQKGAAYRGTLPAAAWSNVLYVFMAAALGWLLFVLLGGWRKRTMSSDLKSVFAWIVAGIVVNAAICGALSGTFSRYQGRVVWLVPLAAILLELQARVEAHAAMRSAKAQG